MKRSFLRSVLTVSALLIACVPSSASPRYGVAELTSPNGHLTNARALNDLGQIVGLARYEQDYLPAVWQNGQMQILNSLKGSYSSEADFINNGGEIVGCCYGMLGDYEVARGLLWQNGRIKDIGSLPVEPKFHYVQPHCINDSGQIVGRVQVALHDDKAFILDKGKMIELDPDPANAFPPRPNGLVASTVAERINNRGQIFGFTTCREYASGFVTGVLWTKNGSNWDHPTVVSLNGPNNLLFSPSAINDAGQIAGTAFNADNDLAAIWQNGVATLLDIPAGYEMSGAGGINEKGEIVGSMSTNPNMDHAFICKCGVTTDLNDLLPADSGWVINSAFDINNRGQILCVASHTETHLDGIPVLLSPLETVTIDIMPGNKQNRIDSKSQAMLDLALYSSRDFDARRLDLNSIKLAGVAPISCRRIDINRDGRSDLLLGFKTSSLALTNEVKKLTLSGLTIDGWQIEGTDNVSIREGR